MGAETENEFNQKVVMVHAMMLACYIDNKMTSQEVATIESYAKSLPEFYGKDFQVYYQAAKNLAAGVDGSLDKAVDILSDIKSEHLRRRVFYCSVELAWCDGDIAGEEKILESFRRALQINHDLADRIRETVALKFAVPA
jgi:tellurite resistance protein